ncbi:MAG: helicase-related protein [Chloroflexota bacterium]
MPTFKPTPEFLGALIERIPEGFIHRSTLKKYVRIYGKQNAPAFEQALRDGLLGQENGYYFDPDRLNAAGVQELAQWSAPVFPTITDDGVLVDRPIHERLDERKRQLDNADAPDYVRIVRALESTPGYADFDSLTETSHDEQVIDDLVRVNVLGRIDDLVYDPLRIGPKTARRVVQLQAIQPVREGIHAYLEHQPGKTAPKETLDQRFGTDTVNQVLSLDGLTTFTVKLKVEPYQMLWVRAKGTDSKAAVAAAHDAVSIRDDAWQESLDQCGAVLRPDAVDGSTLREQVIARSYTVNRAAKRLALQPETIETATIDGIIHSFVDPEGHTRLPAAAVEEAVIDPEYGDLIASVEPVRVKDIATLSGVSYSTVRKRLRRAGLGGGGLQWGDVRGRWKLPDTYADFQTSLIEILEEKRRARIREIEERQRHVREQQEAERRRREELRARLVAAFPSWQHSGRHDQQIKLHVGPPNSGKTHDALDALVRAGSGWYLAPLRLLAFEIFDRLNQRGVPCNLLTGEEYIPIPGAQFTAATIEMFNPMDSGACVIIDEAQLLADADRGWAWTRALMEAEAPEIHVIAPLTARDLIVKLAGEAAIPCDVIEHQRLAPIKIAEKATPLENLEPRTILVAFSRRMVLHLKTELERMRRTVSVVYGSLPPEVRRKQADRFANGETEICVATDAVGMGLNLPADYVCFYEVEKFDGSTVRLLTPAEVQQIGGRAGRFGISKAGEIGSVTRRDLRFVRDLYYAEPEVLTHARVAPTVEDLEMIPGTLPEKLEQWASLQSIPETLRGAIKTTDLTERIELARMLTEEQVRQLGLEAAIRLINAPTRQSSRAYWLSCAQAIIAGRTMPLPPEAPSKVKNSRDLETTEICISCADIYLWLCSRREFHLNGGDDAQVRTARMEWSSRIDDALLQKIDTARRCSQCGRRLPRDHRYGVCNRCFSYR